MVIVSNLFDRFGGVRPMAAALIERRSSVQSSKTAGRIPSTKQPEVLKKARELSIQISALAAVFPLNGLSDVPRLTDLPPPYGEVDCHQRSVLQREGGA
ncbi:carph-isopro domain-containing protein [Sphingomonas sp. STIS6.2]|uniref:carph-isopro domain-containing protein n=1 Tax=Sphingomonas sp. STIS6.2 TaxID=1379700 RepID=UPI003FA3AACB